MAAHPHKLSAGSTVAPDPASVKLHALKQPTTALALVKLHASMWAMAAASASECMAARLVCRSGASRSARFNTNRPPAASLWGKAQIRSVWQPMACNVVATVQALVGRDVRTHARVTVH